MGAAHVFLQEGRQRHDRAVADEVLDGNVNVVVHQNVAAQGHGAQGIKAERDE